VRTDERNEKRLLEMWASAAQAPTAYTRRNRERFAQFYCVEDGVPVRLTGHGIEMMHAALDEDLDFQEVFESELAKADPLLQKMFESLESGDVAGHMSLFMHLGFVQIGRPI
jgi:hypothetical protein